jgi:hypothetical protein
MSEQDEFDKLITVRAGDLQSLLDALISYRLHCCCTISQTPQTFKNETKRLLKAFDRIEHKDGYDYYRFGTEVGLPPLYHDKKGMGKR